MLASVFNSKRNKVNKHKKFSTIAGLRRAQSPPSPASFVSPEIVEINEKGPFGATVPEERLPSTSIDRSVTSPQLQLSFETGGTLSEWLPPSIVSPENRTPPKRNVSLPNGGRTVPDGTPSSSTKGLGSPDDTIKEELEPLQPNRLYVDTSGNHTRSSEEVTEASTSHSSRKPTPSPIKIPNNLTSTKIKLQRSSTDDVVDIKPGDIPPPLPTKGSRPPSPSSAITDDLSSAISGTSLARALVANSFILSNETRASKYKSGTTRQDSATLPRGEHPLNNSPHFRGRPVSGSEPGSARSSSVPPVPQLPWRDDLGLSVDDKAPSRRNSVTLVLENGEKDSLEPSPHLKRSKSTGRLRREQTTSMPPISPISEASSPTPSVPNTPVVIGKANSNSSNPSLPNSVTQQRNLEHNASSSSLGTGEGSVSHHARAATEPVDNRRPSNVTKPLEVPRKNTLMPNGAIPGTMRSSGVFPGANGIGRLAVTRSISEAGVPRGTSAQPARPAVLLPIGERPTSMLVPPSPQPSILSNLGPTPTSSRLGSSNVTASETPVDSPDLLDNFPLQIGRERSVGPPPPLPLGRRSEDSGTESTPIHSSSGESMLSATLTDRQTFPETPNAFSPLWSAGFASPPGGSRVSLDRGSSRGAGSSRSPEMMNLMRVAQRAPSLISGGVYTGPGTRSSRVPLTPPLTGEGASSRPSSPQMDPPLSPPAVKRLTAIEEQGPSRAMSAYSTIPEPPTSGTQFTNGVFSIQQSQGPPVPSVQRGRDRSESVSAYSQQSESRDGTAYSQGPNRSQTTMKNTHGTTTNSMSPGQRAKAAEASSHRRMRSVTNPDEPLGSPPPSYVPSFDPPPPPPPLAHEHTAMADSSEPSSRSSLSLQSSVHLQASSSQSSIPQKRSLSPFPSPPNSSGSSSPSLGRSRIDAHASSISVEQPPPPYVEEPRGSTPPMAVSQIQSGVPPPGSAPPARITTPDLPPTPLRATYGTPESTPTKRITRIRPPLPQGPRKPSYSAAAARMRAGSVSSSSAAGPSSSNPRMVSMMSHAAPRFQTSRVNFRGLTMEAAQWTLTSQQLQHIVSTAIRQSADASAIRILPAETLDDGLPTEIERLEVLSAELKLKYKLGVRKRNTLLANASRISESAEIADEAVALGRTMEELSDLTESLDQTAEELYTVTDQLAQLNHLRDVHQRSALAMALRKLNSSFLKQVGEVQRLRDQVATLEAERDEAWREAQEVAQEFDDFTDRIVADVAPSAGSSKGGDKDKDKDSMTPSRRSSRVMVARKNSQRASKAGLRSMYRRSHRSSTSSNHRYSGAASPGAWTGPSGSEEIPPVPPIPSRRDLFLQDFPTRSSMESPSSELRAMVQAQKELCEMLGISLEELKTQNHGPSRRQSMSAIPGPKSPGSAAPTRRNSDIITPNHQRSFRV